MLFLLCAVGNRAYGKGPSARLQSAPTGKGLLRGWKPRLPRHFRAVGNRAYRGIYARLQSAPTGIILEIDDFLQLIRHQ